MTTTGDFIARALDRCRRVAGGADELRPVMNTFMPFAGDDLDELDVMQRTAAVAFLKRFEQLQDLLARAARGVAGWEGADGAMTHRDVGDWFEKRGILADAEEWMVAVRLRNRLVHEYPIEEEEQVRRLNESWSLMPMVQGIARDLIALGAARGLS